MTNQRKYKLLLLSQVLKGLSSFTFWMTAFLSFKASGHSESFIVEALFILPLVSLFTDIPTGVYADRVSCRSALLLSGLCDLSAFGLFAMAGTNQYAVPFGIFFKALGFSFESGAGGQLVYNLASNHYGASIGSKKAAIHTELTVRASSLLGGGIGGYLLSKNPVFPWILAGFAVLGSLVILIKIDSPENLRRRFSSSISETTVNIASAIKICLALGLIPITLFKLAEGFRTGTEGFTFVPFIGGILPPALLGILPLIATLVRTPFVILTWKEKIKLPEQSGLYALLAFVSVACFTLLLSFTNSIGAALACACFIFISYTFRDMCMRHWENQIVASQVVPSVTLRSAFSTLSTAAQLIGTALLTHSFFGENLTSYGLRLAATVIMVLIVPAALLFVLRKRA